MDQAPGVAGGQNASRPRDDSPRDDSPRDSGSNADAPPPRISQNLTRQSGAPKLSAPHSGSPLAERFYRAEMGSRFRSWILSRGESDLWIGVSPESWKPEMEDSARRALLDARAHIEGYEPPGFGEARNLLDAPSLDAPAPGAAAGQPLYVRAGHEFFVRSLAPLPDDSGAPLVVRAMLRAGLAAGVGPMAAVAGAIAEYVGKALKTAFGCEEVIVENGGDLWLSFSRPLEIAVFAGTSPLSNHFAVELSPELSPCGLCTSSGTVGPSLSFGYADASVILCADAARADAWATASCNAVKTAEDIDPVLSMLKTKPDVLGSLIVVGDRMGIQGRFRLLPLAPRC